MPGTLTITTLSDGTNSTSATNCISGSAKAWVNFVGTGSISTNQTIRGSYNVAYVFKNTTGDFTIAFTNSLADANYSVVGMSQSASATYAASSYAYTFLYATSPQAPGSVRIATMTTFNNGYADYSTTCIAVFR